ncbi:unnamed protein product [Adineta steineri]|uniref:Uncharacterized protein n=1 Tax=Adineta steineri TaxID=433720 RepID=A0A813PTR4_9BILA|nr:unnamed protein product [Adineta steineri]
MTYTIDCSNVVLNDNKLIYHAQPWTILEDKIDDDETINDYTISIDLSNSSSFKQFNNKTIQLTGFSFSIHSLSLTNQPKQFQLDSNAFNSLLYQNLQILNLSSCCQQIPVQCPELFRPLNKLEVLDLSGSDMYKSCLNTPNTISSTLRDLILRNNNYDTNTFSHTSPFFTGINTITGKLDLQSSRFNMSTQLQGNCLFDLFTKITILDLSSLQFISISNNTEIHLKHLLKCKISSNNIYNGKQLIELYLRKLNLQFLPEWFTNDRFPQLTQLDLSNNYIYSIDLQTFTKLTSISLAYNPIELNKILWCSNLTYESINLRSTIQNYTSSLVTDLENLFKLSTNIDYSNNYRNISHNNLTKFTIDIDFSDNFSLNLSQINLYSFDIQDISRFDDLNQLDISSNNLIELNLEKQSKLIYLDCSNQYLKNLILNNENSNLIQLKCSNNSLKTIENFHLDQQKSLKSIDLSYNQITILNSQFTSQHLHTINFKSNVIENISSNIFHKNLISLYSIDLSWNKINSIEKNAFQSPNLQILDLTGNPLKLIQVNFLFTSSLRLFYIVNNTQELRKRCAEIKNDNLLLTYLRWYETNGTYMNNFQQIQFNQCLRPYMSRSKTKWIRFPHNYQIKHLSLYITMSAITIGIILGVIYLYRKNQLNFLSNLYSYRPLERNILRDDMNHDDEIIMNLDESPFNNNNRMNN